MQTVLITGASTGIGHSTALFLAERGFYVFAGARKQEDIDALNAIDNIEGIRLDVTSSTDIEKVVERISQDGLYGLVNNAGIAIAGPLMEIEKEQLELQFNVNVFGLHELTKACFPLLRDSEGRIVNISSVAGQIAPPFMGPYSMSKFALEAYSDSLRRELDPFGIKVSIIEPGDVKTPIWDKRYIDQKKIDASPFASRARKMERYLVSRAKKSGMDPIKISKAIHHALTSKKPKIRYLIARSNLMHRLTTLLPASMVDRSIRKNL
ncbi:MAG: SDR family oxidoreductase [Methanobacteriota archaeon]|nr:MAG: SDR family oxidoreductase [Euryarchaeota archaeon]